MQTITIPRSIFHHFDASNAAVRFDRKGQGQACGNGWISARKKCSKKNRQKLAQKLKSGDKTALARAKRSLELKQERKTLSKAVARDKGKKARDLPGGAKSSNIDLLKISKAEVDAVNKNPKINALRDRQKALINKRAGMLRNTQAEKAISSELRSLDGDIKNESRRVVQRFRDGGEKPGKQSPVTPKEIDSAISKVEKIFEKSGGSKAGDFADELFDKYGKESKIVKAVDESIQTSQRIASARKKSISSGGETSLLGDYTEGRSGERVKKYLVEQGFKPHEIKTAQSYQQGVDKAINAVKKARLNRNKAQAEGGNISKSEKALAKARGKLEVERESLNSYKSHAQREVWKRNKAAKSQPQKTPTNPARPKTAADQDARNAAIASFTPQKRKSRSTKPKELKGKKPLTTQSTDITQPDQRRNFAQQEMERARRSGDKNAAKKWEEEVKKARIAAVKAEQKRVNTTQGQLFGIETGSSLPLFAQQSSPKKKRKDSNAPSPGIFSRRDAISNKIVRLIRMDRGLPGGKAKKRQGPKRKTALISPRAAAIAAFR